MISAREFRNSFEIVFTLNRAAAEVAAARFQAAVENSYHESESRTVFPSNVVHPLFSKDSSAKRFWIEYICAKEASIGKYG